MKYSWIDSPLGPLLIAGDETGIVGLWLPTGKNVKRPQPGWTRADGFFETARTQLAEYFAGARTEFDLPLSPAGTAFQLRCWAALRQIPFGQTASYGEQAARIGQPTASRAVGLANGQNPISIIVPCHRIVGANGSLTGYAGGVEAKRWLLAHEAAHSGLFAT